MDNGKIRIKLEGEFTAPELEEIIRDLAEARAGLEPAVPQHPPTGLTEDSIVLVQDQARHSFRRLAGGGLRIWLRSEGVGWMAFTISPAAVAGIREFLSQQGPGAHTAH